MEYSKYLIIVLFLVVSHSSHGAKVYKCTDASGQTVFSNMRCKGGEPEVGLIAEDKEISQKTKITQGYVAPITGLSNAEKALRQLRMEKDRERLIARQERAERRARTLNDVQILQAQQQRSTPKANKVDCKYNKAKSKYWKERARERGTSKKDKYSYKSYQYMYEGKSGGC